MSQILPSGAPSRPAVGVKRIIREAYMNNRGRILVAMAIFAALAGVLGYDLLRDRKPPAGDAAARSPESSPAISVEPEPAFPPFVFEPPRASDTERRPAGPAVRGNDAPPAGPAARPGVDPASETLSPSLSPPVPPSINEEYIVRDGDTLASIAEKKYGDPNLWRIIQKANPNADPRRLRIGSKLTLPTRGAEETSLAGSAEPVVDGGQRVYVIQPGDTLEGIAKWFYGSWSAASRIHRANVSVIPDPDRLDVGVKIVLPESAKASETVVTPGVPGTARTAAEIDPAATAARTHAIQRGDSLWKIAARYHGGQGIVPFMDRIVQANPDKLQSTSTPLKEGWVLAIPD